MILEFYALNDQLHHLPTHVGTLVPKLRLGGLLASIAFTNSRTLYMYFVCWGRREQRIRLNLFTSHLRVVAKRNRLRGKLRLCLQIVPLFYTLTKVNFCHCHRILVTYQCQ